MAKYYYATKEINGKLNWRVDALHKIIIFDTEEKLVINMTLSDIEAVDYDVSTGTAKEIMTMVLIEVDLLNNSSNELTDEQVVKLMGAISNLNPED